jgi:CBS domain-containing protein
MLKRILGLRKERLLAEIEAKLKERETQLSSLEIELRKKKEAYERILTELRKKEGVLKRVGERSARKRKALLALSRKLKRAELRFKRLRRLELEGKRRWERLRKEIKKRENLLRGLRKVAREVDRRLRRSEMQRKKAEEVYEKVVRRLRERERALRTIGMEHKRFQKRLKSLRQRRREFDAKIRKLRVELERLRKEARGLRGREMVARLRQEVREKLRETGVRPVRVHHVMTREVKYVKESDTLRDVVEIFTKHRISGLPVLRKGRVVGIITESDIFRIVGADNILDIKDTRFLEETEVRNAMTKNVLTVNENDSLEVVIALMNKARVNRLPVLDNRGRMVGIVARNDVIKGIMEILFFRALEKAPEFIETDIDRMLRIIEEGPIAIDELARKVKVGEAQVEEWIRMLEKGGVVELIYPPVGKPLVRMVS